MINWVVVGTLWIAGIICCYKMKKIQPESFGLYLVYVIAICLLVTAVAIRELILV